MTNNNLVTKSYLDKALRKQKDEIIKAIIDFMQTLIIPRLNRMDKKLDAMISKYVLTA